MKRKSNKKAQSEIVGFVIIVIMIVIISLIFLFFSSRKEKTEFNVHAETLLEALMHMTTNCSISNQKVDVRKISDLCLEKEICDDGNNSCDIFKHVTEKALEESIENVQILNSNLIGYDFSVIYLMNDTNYQEPILRLEKGNCTANRMASQDFVNTERGGQISFVLELCFS